MAIEWNKVTWYSKLLAALFFIFVLPVVTFYVGREYEQTRKDLESYKVIDAPIGEDSISSIPDDTASVTAAIPTSGIYGKVLLGGKAFVGHIALTDSRGRIITTTKTRSDGHFFLLLPPGPYKISAVPTKEAPKPVATPVTVNKNSVSKPTINI